METKMKYNEYTIPVEQVVDEAPMGLVKTGMNKLASFVPGSIGAQAKGALQTGGNANAMYKEFYTYLGQKGLKPTTASISAFLKTKGVSDAIIKQHVSAAASGGAAKYPQGGGGGAPAASGGAAPAAGGSGSAPTVEPPTSAPAGKPGNQATPGGRPMPSQTFKILDKSVVDQIKDWDGTDIESDFSSVTANNPETIKNLIAYAKNNPSQLQASTAPASRSPAPAAQTPAPQQTTAPATQKSDWAARRKADWERTNDKRGGGIEPSGENESVRLSESQKLQRLLAKISKRL